MITQSALRRIGQDPLHATDLMPHTDRGKRGGAPVCASRDVQPCISIEGHTRLATPLKTGYQQRLQVHERPPTTSAPSTHIACKARQLMPSVCGAVREAHRQYGWMDARLTSEAPAEHLQASVQHGPIFVRSDASAHR